MKQSTSNNDHRVRRLMLASQHPKAVADLDAEMSLVRMVIDQPQLISRIRRTVTPQDFADRVCSSIWQVIERLAQSRRPIGFDEVVRELDPKDVLGPDGCDDGLSVAECIRQTIADASGTADEVRWCALRIRARSFRNSLLNILGSCERALIAGRSKDVRDLFSEACELAAAYRQADLRASRELGRLQRAAPHGPDPGSAPIEKAP